MGKIKRSNVKEIKGITNELSGAGTILEFTRKGVIRGLRNPIHIKRPNQYLRKKRS